MRITYDRLNVHLVMLKKVSLGVYTDLIIIPEFAFDSKYRIFNISVEVHF